MESHERSRVVELLLKEDLEAVTMGLEQGLYCWEEINLAYDSEGCTPLIDACRMGLTTVMHFLLERGADATLCNHGNQTALHVRHPALEEELLSSLIRDLPHQMQLSDVAWRGDLCHLQDLMAQTDLLDFNQQNRDGLTPLMLAVRDVDLFERLQLPWKYDPVDVVKKLLSLSVDMTIIDKGGHTVLWYVSRIRSSKKDDLFKIMNSMTQEETMFTCLECYWAGSPAVSPSCSPTWDYCTSEIKIESSKASQNIHTDIYKDNIICTKGSMEPKINIRRYSIDERKRSSRTSSLPSLWESRQGWDKTRLWHPSIKMTSSVPVFPVAYCTQTKPISTSMEPPLDANLLKQARANIYNRLKGPNTEEEVITKKVSLPSLFRTPKHLAPLDSGYRNGPALTNLEYPPHVKPPITLPFLSKSRRKVEQISKSSSRPRSTREGSEESHSCSSSSQEEEESVPQEIYTVFRELTSQLSFDDLNCSKVNDVNASIIISEDRKGNTPTTSPIDRQVESEERHDFKTSADSEELQKMSLNVDSHCNEPRRIIDNGSCDIQDEKCNKGSVVDQVLHEESKTLKVIKSNNRKCKVSFHTNQSFNILAHQNQSTAKTTGNGTNLPIHSKVKLRENVPTCVLTVVKTPNKHLPRMPSKAVCKKTKAAAKTTKKVFECCPDASVEDKKVINTRGLKSAEQSKKPMVGATLRVRSAVDHVTYNDMFLKIGQGDEGPTIYEMFATPVYKNLRADSFAEETKQSHTELKVKRQTSGKQRVQKTIDVNRRKQPQSERYSRPKCRQHKRRDSIPKRIKMHPPPSENKGYDVTSDCEAEKDEENDNKVTCIENDGNNVFSWDVKRQNSQMLSVIEEVLSNTLHKPREQKTLETNLNSTTQDSQIPNNVGEPQILSMSRFPAQPLINTWTSDSTESPVHQRFLEEVGDGLLTDDLLRSLAKGLISLEEKEVETSETDMKDREEFSKNLPSKFKKLLNEEVSSGEHQYIQRLGSDDASITWTKGELLGKGAYGAVYCGLTSQGQLIAVKQVSMDASTSDIAEKEYDRLEREVDLLKNLQHSNIVGFLGTALSENTVSIFMEYVPGGSIASVLSRFGPLPEKVFALYTQQILEGVAYLHANRVIHRDLKGNNIMLMPTGVVKLIDFGCARRLNCLTLSGSKGDLLKSVHGTPYWMAPEVINETGHGRKSDIWSIGCTVFEMATGKPPLAHMAKMAALFYIGARRGLMPSLPNNFSTHAKELVQACLNRDPRERPSAKELLRHPFICHHSLVCKRTVH